MVDTQIINLLYLYGERIEIIFMLQREAMMGKEYVSLAISSCIKGFLR
jgi:hypothetical protein